MRLSRLVTYINAVAVWEKSDRVRIKFWVVEYIDKDKFVSQKRYLEPTLLKSVSWDSYTKWASRMAIAVKTQRESEEINLNY